MTESNAPSDLVEKILFDHFYTGEPGQHEAIRSAAAALRAASPPSGDAVRDVRAHKVMTAEEYSATPIKGWHEVCRDVDGFGGIGIRFLGITPDRPQSEINAMTPHQFSSDYEFRGDDGDYTPTENERAMIEDAIEGYLAALPPRGDAVREAREIVTEWLGMFDPPPQIDFQQSEFLQGAIATAIGISSTPSWRGDTIREALASAMMRCGLATGHGDTFESLLSEMEWQVQRFQNRLAALPSSGAKT